MSQDLNKLFKQIQKEAEEMGVAAMRNAANKAFVLAKEKAESCLQTYYKRKPKIYKRTNTLQEAIKYIEPVETWNENQCVISFGVNYDSSRIKGKYKSRSLYHQSGDKWVSRATNPGKFNFDSASNGIPDSGWILRNYMVGWHPGFIYNKATDQLENRGWKDGQENSTDYRMTQFFEKELFEKAGKLIYESMKSAVIDFLKTNGGGK